MMKYHNVRHKKHILEAEKEKVEMRQLLEVNGLEAFGCQLLEQPELAASVPVGGGTGNLQSSGRHAGTTVSVAPL